MAVVKANAYGHGAVRISSRLNEIGIDHFAVVTIDEGIQLRKRGIEGEILILGYTTPLRSSELSRYDLTQTAVDISHAVALNNSGKSIKTHIKVNTGMNRLGENFDHVSGIADLFKFKNLEITGIFTHLCVSDSFKTDDVVFTNEQIQKFYELLNELKSKNILIPKIHMQSSYGVLNYPGLVCDYARIGIVLYGVLSTPNSQTRLSPDLRPILSLKSKIILIRTIGPGECVGYGRNFAAKRKTKVAIVSIGYGDGLPRCLSERKCYVLIRGHRAFIAGKICMDQLMTDVTEIPGVTEGDIVTLIGEDGCEEITAEQMAEKADTITNELLSRLGNRVERIFL
jgi:serine/alanine racemase